MNLRTFLLFTVAVIAATTTGCGAKAVRQLTGAGATFPYPLYSKWFDVYNRETGIEINYQSIGSGGGIQQLKSGTVDFGASDAPLSDEKLKEMPAPVIHFPTAGGAVAVAFNLPGVPQLRLTPETLAGIFLGSIKTWRDPKVAADNVGVALPNTPIQPVHRSDGSGTTFIFVSYLAAVSPEWKERVGVGTSVSWPVGIGGKGNEGVAGLVRQTPGTIGYVELAYAKQNNFTVVHLRNRSGNFVEPTLASTTAAAAGAAEALAQDVRTMIVDSPAPDAYPISGLTYLLVYQEQKDAAKARALAEFIRWAVTEGQQLAEGLDYARLPDEVVRVNQSNLARITADGRPVVASR